MKRLLYLAICLPLAWLTACDVHEFPDDWYQTGISFQFGKKL